MTSSAQVKEAKPKYPVFILPLFLLMSIPIRMLLKKYSVPLNPNLLLIVVAALFSGLILAVPAWRDTYEGISEIPPQILLAVFLPVFTVSRIYRMDYYIFIRCLPQGILISTVGVLIYAIILGLIIKDILHSDWSLTMGIMAGLVSVPLQPNFIISLFKDLAKYKFLGTLLETEAIFCVIPVLISMSICLGIHENIIISWYQGIIIISRYIIGGLLFGMIMGKLTAIMMCWMYNEMIGALCVSIGMSFFTFFSCEFLFAFSGVLATICVARYMAVEKHRFSSEVDHCIYNFWGTLNYMFEIGILMNCTAEIIKNITKVFDVRVLYGTVVIYFSANITRFLTFVVLSPILNRMTYDINVRCLLVLGWSGVKGNLNLIIVLILLNDSKTNKMAQQFLLEILVFSFLTLSVNSTTMRMTMKLIGLSELSSSRRTNMNNCMRFIMDKRICIINILKLNRYLSDANWALVRSETLMKHPYRLNMDAAGIEEDDEWFNTRNVLCPDCLKEVPLDISEKEMEDMLKEAQIKILKAKKVSVIKQYEKGTINKNCLQILVNALDIMIESNPKHNRIDLTHYLTKNKALDRFTKFLNLVDTEILKQMNPPNTACRRCCYYIVTHKAYDFIIYGIILILCTIIVLTYEDLIKKEDYYMVITYIWLIFVADMLMKITGFSFSDLCNDGLRTYFKSFWNIFDVICLTMESCQIVYLVASHFSPQENLYALEMFFMWQSFLRIFRIFAFIKTLHPKIISYFDYLVDLRICFGYDLATAVVNTCDEIIEVIGQLIEVKLIRDIILKQIIEEKIGLIKEMEQVQRERPWIAITVKTKQAIRTTLNSMEEALNELKVSGFVDKVEYAIIFKEIFEKQKFLRNLKFVQPSSPKVIFNEVPWMAEDEAIIEYLYNHVEAVAWDAGETVCKDGKSPLGVFIVVTGLLRLKYTPNAVTLRKLRDFGKIPIVDYLSTLKFDEKMEDNIMSGSSIGELSILTGRPYDCTIVADSPSQAYLLTSTVLKAAMKLNPDPVKGLQSRMWKCTTINLAVAVLMDIPLYQSFTQEQIKFKLEKSFMPNLKCYKMFIITEIMDDVILLEGIVCDYNSGDVYAAPTLLPRTIQKLILPTSSYLSIEEKVETKLLIIPMGEVNEYEIMEHEEEIAELVSFPSSTCLLHRQEHMNKIKKKQGTMKRLMSSDPKVLTRESASNVSVDHQKFESLDR